MCQQCSPWRVGCQAATGQARSRRSPPGGRGLCLLCVWHYSPALPLPSVQKPSDGKAGSTPMFQNQLQIAPLTPVALILSIWTPKSRDGGRGTDARSIHRAFGAPGLCTPWWRSPRACTCCSGQHTTGSIVHLPCLDSTARAWIQAHECQASSNP